MWGDAGRPLNQLPHRRHMGPPCNQASQLLACTPERTLSAPEPWRGSDAFSSLAAQSATGDQTHAGADSSTSDQQRLGDAARRRCKPAQPTAAAAALAACGRLVGGEWPALHSPRQINRLPADRPACDRLPRCITFGRLYAPARFLCMRCCKRSAATTTCRPTRGTLRPRLAASPPRCGAAAAAQLPQSPRG